MIFIKFGSECLKHEGKVDFRFHEQKAKEIERGLEAVLVVSGSILLGKERENDTRSNDQLTDVELQGYASVGQAMLIDELDKLYRRNVAQIQLSDDIIDNKQGYVKLIHHNLEKGRISVFNYNDTVDFNQVRLDNDTPGARLACYSGADQYIILGRYDGFLDGQGELIERVHAVDDKIYSYCNGKSECGNGGFVTKLNAAEICLGHGVDMRIANVEYDLADILSDAAPHTLFRK